MSLDNNGVNALGQLFRNMAAFPAKVKLAQQEGAMKGLLNQSLIDNRNADTALQQQKFDALKTVLDYVGAQDLSDPNIRNELVSTVNGKAYLPFENIGSTGATFNRATGDVRAHRNALMQSEIAARQARAQKFINGGGVNERILTPSQIRESFITLSNGEDVYQKPTVFRHFDEDRYKQYMADAAKHPGYVHTPGNVAKYLGGVMPWGNQTAPAAPVATPPITQTFNPVAKALSGTDAIRQRYLNGEITREEAKLLLNQLGIQ